MPYSKKSELPSRIKKMSKKKQEAWMKAFNSAYKSKKEDGASEEKAESYAFSVANNAIKDMKESVDNMSEFGLKQKLERIRENGDSDISHVYESSLLSKDRVQITEADSNNPKAVITVIESGISNNRFQYSDEVIESLNLFIQEGKKKLYVNHEEDKRRYGRNLKEWGATFLETWTVKENGKTKIKAKIDFKGAHEGDWLLEAMMHHPEEVGFSIDAYAKVQEAEGLDGKPVLEVVEWKGYNSTDFVGNPSAGGKTDQVLENHVLNDFDIIEQTVNSLSTAFEKKTEQNKVYTLLRLFMDMLSDTRYAMQEDSEEERREYISELVSDFLEEFGDLDIVRAFEAIEGENYTVTSEGNVGNLNDDDKEEKMEIKSAKDLQKNFPEIFSAVQENAVNEYKNTQEQDSEMEDLKNEVSELKESLETKEEKAEELEKELKEANKTIGKYELKEQQESKEAEVRKAVKESDLPEFDKLPEKVQEALMDTEEDELKESIEAYEKLREDSKDSGVRNLTDTKENEENTKENTKVDLKDPDAVDNLLG